MKNKLDIERVRACAKDAFELLCCPPLEANEIWDALSLFYSSDEIMAATVIILDFVIDRA